MSDASPLPQSLRDEIQTAYRHYLAERQFRPRYGQRLMIAEIARGLAGGEGAPVAVVEAGTGTGKTVAYLLAALPTARYLDKRLVISTATVALQDQIVAKDLPDLARHSGLSFSFALAKGRSRYLCLSKLDQLLSQDQEQAGLALYEDEAAMRLDEPARQLFAELADAYVGGRWDGDRDAWPQEIAAEQWQLVTTDHRQCSNRRCPHFSGCCFFKAREQLDQADLIVANHDLVLADLALGGGAVLPEPEQTLYVFDEGHHLADTAIQHFSYRLRLRSLRNWSKQLAKSLQRLAKELPGAETLLRYLPPTHEALLALDELLPELLAMAQALLPAEPARDNELQHHRFPGGLLPEALQQQCQRLAIPLRRLAVQLDSLVETLKEALSEPLVGIDRAAAERWHPPLGRALSRAEGGLALLRDYAEAAPGAGAPQARWMTEYPFDQGDDLELASSPILAAATLASELWSRCAGAVVTSATLTALGQFDHFRLCSGVPADSRFSRVPSPFDYTRNGVLRLPRLAADPGHPEAHDEAVAQALEGFIDPMQGALVLFTSWRQLRRVRERLDCAWREQILAQGDHGKQEIINRHRARLDEGKGSIIFGLASFAEGIDLPGHYLTQVVIAKIPFAVPGDPVEAALHEWVREQGRDPFNEISVPLASVRLIQACGRLIRSESDGGEVMILDNRLRTRRYGRDLLAALPPFRIATD